MDPRAIFLIAFLIAHLPGLKDHHGKDHGKKKKELSFQTVLRFSKLGLYMVLILTVLFD